ncbi:apyrase [Malassezia cuniculi]|uniref:Apyrase n=1 Tax=Malassezia cuniculi TaxID=948313 RepID=A0AAF0ENU0_9BASI|nr:apyrase [Malassezia cuniculi]
MSSSISAASEPKRRRRAPILNGVATTAAAHNAEVEWYKSRKYAIVIDAGSSGSRMMIYSWRHPAHEIAERQKQGLPLNVLPTVEKGTWEGSPNSWQRKVEPGISSFAGNTTGMRDYLAPLIEFAKEAIPEEAHAHTSLHVLATAGMRLVPHEERYEILDEVCAIIRTSPFNVQKGESCGEQVKVITGEEEGLLGWISINYLMDGFMSNATEQSERSSTFGFLDMGGASTQIAFEPSDTGTAINMAAGKVSGKQHTDVLNVQFQRLDFSSVSHKVFTTTFLGFGTNAARSRFTEVLAEKEENAEVHDPCLPRGLELSYGDKKLQGGGDFGQCVAMQAPLLDKDAECNKPPCLFHGVHVPPIDFSINRFIGISEYWYSAHDVFDLGGVYDYAKFQEAAADFCGEDWRVLESKLGTHAYKPQVTRERLQMQCFKAAWVANILHEGIGLPRPGDAKIEDDANLAAELPGKAGDHNIFQSVNDVHGLGVSWTLGRAVLQASHDVSALADGAGARIAVPVLPVRGIERIFPLVLASAVVLALFVALFFRRRKQQDELPVSKSRHVRSYSTGSKTPVSRSGVSTPLQQFSRSPKSVPKRSSSARPFIRAPPVGPSLRIVTDIDPDSPIHSPLFTPISSSVRDGLSSGLVSRAVSPGIFESPREGAVAIARSASPALIQVDEDNIS